MDIKELREKVIKWDRQNDEGETVASAKYTTILNQLEYHAENEWKVYLPAEHPDFNSNYLDRLAGWVGNVADTQDQKLLLEYALHISFFSHQDFIALYQAAFNRITLQWIASQTHMTLDENGWESFQNFVNTQVKQHTWFCPVTDSMDINEFYKVNHIAGISFRPGFAALQMMAVHQETPSNYIADIWNSYMDCPSKPPLNYLVLLEDVVGSGTQCIETIKWAATNIKKPVLFIPLILCPNGVKALREEEVRSNGRLTVRPVIELHRNDLLGSERKKQKAWPISEKLECLVERTSAAASPYQEPFGYKSTGCSIVTFSNTPDNTLPMVHNKPKNNLWEPLFPRVYRD